MNNHQKIVNLFSDINEDFITNYHNDLFKLIKNEYISICNEIDQEQEHEKLIELKWLRDQYSHHAEVLANNVFLMFYSYADEWILLKISNTQFKNLISNSGSITRFKDPLNKIGIDISKKDWSILAEAEHIRNCLSHANGRIDLACLKNKKLQKIINAKNKSSFIETKNERLYIKREYLNHFKEAIRNILHHPYPYKKDRNLVEKLRRCVKLIYFKIKSKYL